MVDRFRYRLPSGTIVIRRQSVAAVKEPSPAGIEGPFGPQTPPAPSAGRGRAVPCTFALFHPRYTGKPRLRRTLPGITRESRKSALAPCGH
ncbi:MAG: hypothetical protein PHV82_12040 [Victivallaceae bacterium]|nr:hypothetical protein [Victivallaceae bacterium]